MSNDGTNNPPPPGVAEGTGAAPGPGGGPGPSLPVLGSNQNMIPVFSSNGPAFGDTPQGPGRAPPVFGSNVPPMGSNGPEFGGQGAFPKYPFPSNLVATPGLPMVGHAILPMHGADGLVDTAVPSIHGSNGPAFP